MDLIMGIEGDAPRYWTEKVSKFCTPGLIVSRQKLSYLKKKSFHDSQNRNKNAILFILFLFLISKNLFARLCDSVNQMYIEKIIFSTKKKCDDPICIAW